MSRVAVFGAGYVGLVTGACFADLGHDVAVRDVVPEKVGALRAGRVPIHEPGLEELLARNRERLRFTLDVREAIEGAEFVYVCVDTPPTYSGDADLSRVWKVVDELPADTSAIVVMKSTVPVGTGEKVRARLDQRGLGSVGYASNPEFTAEGTAVRDFTNPDRIVIGAFDALHGDAVEALHAGIEAPVVRCDVASAEMIKLAANAALMMRVSFINEIANVCEVTGADVVKVAEGVGLDRRVGPHFLRAGIGYGGSCLVGGEVVFVANGQTAQPQTLESLFDRLRPDDPGAGLAVAEPVSLHVLSWRAGCAAAEMLPVAIVTRRGYDGDVVRIETDAGTRIECTIDHPLLVARVPGGRVELREAASIAAGEWMPAANVAALPRIPAAVAAGESFRLREDEEPRAELGWVRVTAAARRRFDGFVYSLEVPEAHTFVTTGGVVVHNCFPKDSLALKQLAANSGYHFQLLNAVIEVNELQKRRVIGKLVRRLGTLRGKKVALLGLAFKPNTDDMREAPSLVLAGRLLAEGADVTAWDPVASPDGLHGVVQHGSVEEALDGADAAVLVTEWSELRDVDWPAAARRMRNALLIDGRNMLDPDAMRAAGFAYEGIGRAANGRGAEPR